MRNAVHRLTLVAVFVSIAIMLFSSPTNAASLYKWVDEKGVTQYSQTPPLQRESQGIKVQKPSQNSVGIESPDLKALREKEAAFQQRDQKKKHEEQQAEEKAKAAAADTDRKRMLTDCLSRKTRRDLEVDRITQRERQLPYGHPMRGRNYVIPQDVLCDEYMK